MLRSTRRGLETWHGRDRVTLADERARQQGTQTSTYTGAPVLDPTDERGQETECCHMAQATAPVLDSTRRRDFVTLLGGARRRGRSRHAHGIPAVVSVCWRCPRRRRRPPISTCLSALVTDRAMEEWYHPSIA